MSIATFHANANRLDQETAPSDDRILREANENFRYLKDAGYLDGEGILGQVEEWTNEFFETHRILFRERNRLGFVRECHGDLHCGNVVFWNGEWTPFDGIEFSQSLMQIDVVNDIAFLAMDLKHRGRPDLASRLISTYFESTGDYTGLVLLRWYMVYRSMVRAKVACMRAHQANLHQGELESQNKEVTMLLQLAKDLMSVGPMRLTITHGFSGSGKSTGAKTVVDRDNALRVRSDIERYRQQYQSAPLPSNSIEQHSLERSSSDEGNAYSTDAMEATYLRLLHLAELILNAGYSVVVDATFLSRKRRDLFRKLAEKLSVEFSILDFPADESTLRERIEKRLLANNDPSEATLEVLKKQMPVMNRLEKRNAFSLEIVTSCLEQFAWKRWYKVAISIGIVGRH